MAEGKVDNLGDTKILSLSEKSIPEHYRKFLLENGRICDNSVIEKKNLACGNKFKAMISSRPGAHNLLKQFRTKSPIPTEISSDDDYASEKVIKVDNFERGDHKNIPFP